MQEIIADENNVDTSAAYVSAAATKDGSLLVVYIPPAHNGSVSVNMNMVNKIRHIGLIQPMAKYIQAETLSFNRGVQSFTPPGKNSTGENDWVLLFTTLKNNGLRSGGISLLNQLLIYGIFVVSLSCTAAQRSAT